MTEKQEIKAWSLLIAATIRERTDDNNFAPFLSLAKEIEKILSESEEN